MVAVPGAAPHTLPEPVTVATDVLTLLHTPPVAPSVNKADDPAHTVAVPLMLPAKGNGLTVTTCVAATVPQPLLTV